MILQSKNQNYTILWLLINAVLVILSYYYLLSGTIRYFKEVGDTQKEHEYTIDLRRILVITMIGDLCLIISSSFLSENYYILTFIIELISLVYLLRIMWRLHKLFQSYEMNDLNA